MAADRSLDPSKLEVSLTLTNKFEGLETDPGDASARSLLLRWVKVAPAPAPAQMGGEAIPLSSWAPVLRAGPPEAHRHCPCRASAVHLGLCSVLS